MKSEYEVFEPGSIVWALSDCPCVVLGTVHSIQIQTKNIEYRIMYDDPNLPALQFINVSKEFVFAMANREGCELKMLERFQTQLDEFEQQFEDRKK